MPFNNSPNKDDVRQGRDDFVNEANPRSKLSLKERMMDKYIDRPTEDYTVYSVRLHEEYSNQIKRLAKQFDVPQRQIIEDSIDLFQEYILKNIDSKKTS
jgi:hypothetical protein